MSKITFSLCEGRPFIRWLFCTLLFISLSSCKKSSPVESDPGTPGRRDYTWRIDTLFMPMNIGSAVWGSSPSDVWLCSDGGFAGAGLQHFDGSKWSACSYMVGGNTIFGFSRNDVWLGSGDGYIYHFDGSDWKRSFKYEVEGAKQIDVWDIWGSAPDDVYACGIIYYKMSTAWEPESNRGFVLHYNGHIWSEVCKGDFNSQFYSVRKEEDKVFVFSYTYIYDSEDLTVYYRLDKGKLKEVYSNAESKIFMGNNYVIGGKVYFFLDHDICRYVNGSLLKVLSVEGENYGYACYGRSTKDVIIRMQDGLAHFNGTDIQYIYHFPSVSMRTIEEPVIFEKEIFFLVWDRGKTLILHGKLNEE